MSAEQLGWTNIRRIAAEHRGRLLAANGVAVLAALCSVPIPLLLPLLVDEVLLGKEDRWLQVMDRVLPAWAQQGAGYIGLMLLVVLALRSVTLVFNVFQSRLFAQVSKDVVYRLRTRLLARLQRLALSEYEELGSGSVITHLVTDLETLDKFVGETLSRFVVAVLTLVGVAAILLWMNWQLALLILLFNPLVIYASRRMGRRVKELKKRENDATAHFTQALGDTLDAIHEVRVGNRQGHFFGRLGDSARNVRDHAVASQWRTDAANRSSGLMFQFGIEVFRAAAMLTVLFSDLSIGEMLAVFSYLWFMIAPMSELLGLQYAYYAAGAALGRLNTLLARTDEPAYAGGQDPFRGQRSLGIELRDVRFAYGDEPVLEGFDLAIAPGEKVALVGSSGGGKSTLVQLLLGFYQPQAGQILYGGVPLEAIGLETVRENVAVVLQHPSLFNDTVRANLTLGRTRDDAACWQALGVAQLADTVRGLANGLDSIVGRSGVRLSGGQRQRLAIARMVLADPKIVILDEATSALDAATEHALHAALQDFLVGRTTLIIAHRLSAVKQADRVVVFDDGRVAEQGEHRELVSAGGLYSRLYGQLQSG